MTDLAIHLSRRSLQKTMSTSLVLCMRAVGEWMTQRHFQHSSYVNGIITLATVPCVCSTFANQWWVTARTWITAATVLCARSRTVSEWQVALQSPLLSLLYVHSVKIMGTGCVFVFMWLDWTLAISRSGCTSHGTRIKRQFHSRPHGHARSWREIISRAVDNVINEGFQ